MRHFIIALGLIFAAQLSFATTIHVPADRPTIQEGINAAGPWGDTILVAPGTYNEQFWFSNKAIVVRSSDGPAVTKVLGSSINQEDYPTVLIDAVHGATLEGFTFRGGPVAIRVQGASTIKNNVLTDQTYADWAALIVEAPATVVNNTICHGANGGIACYSAAAIISNNIIAYNNNYGIYGECHATYNDVYGNAISYTGGASPGEGSLNANPLFVDDLNRDFHLSPGSPCVDAGNPDPQYRDADGSRNDIGAFSIINYPNPGIISFGTASNGNYVYTLEPDIYWHFHDTGGTIQSGYEIQVGTDNDWEIAEMWATGPVMAADTTAKYSGYPLADKTKYYIRIRVSNGTIWGKWSENYLITHSSLITRIPADQPTIQAGIDAASDGDTILVAPGTYCENITFLGKRITVASEAGPEATILAACMTGDPVVRFVNGEPRGAGIIGFTITGSGNSGIYCERSSPLIQGNIITANSSSEINDGAGINLKNTIGAAVRGNLIFNNHAFIYGCAITVGGEGTYNYTDTICRNVIYDNSGKYDIRVLGDVSGLAIFNNTVVSANLCGLIHQGSGNIEVRNNIFCNAQDVGMSDDSWFPGTITCEYNCLFDNGENLRNVAPGSGMVYENAQFRNPLYHDYSLMQGSPCIDAGDPSPIFNDPDGTRNDIGASPAAFGYPCPVNINFGPESKDTYIFNLQPDIIWSFCDTGGTTQVGYEIEVGMDNEWDSAEMWATGQVMSSDTTAEYAGFPLEDNTGYYLRIRLSNGAVWGTWAEKFMTTHLPAVVHIPADHPTIQAGINASVYRDTVLVAPGVYYEQLTIDNKAVVVRSSEGPAFTAIVGATGQFEGRAIVTIGSAVQSETILEGFTFQGRPIAVEVYGAPTIRRNVMCYQTHAGWAALVVHGPAIVINNTIVFAANGGVACYSPQAVIKNNIIAYNAGYGIYGECQATYNDVYNFGPNYTGGAMPSGWSISTDPRFVAMVNADFRISSNSPCIDAGDPDSIYNDPDGTRNDMGAIPYRKNSLPVLSPIGAKSVAEMDTLIFGVTATDLDGQIAFLIADPVPIGADFIDSGNGRGAFTWIPDYTQAGVHNVTFTAYDDSGETDFEVVPITVANTNSPPGPFNLLFPPDTVRSQVYDFPTRFRWTRAIEIDGSDSIYYQLLVSPDPDFSSAIIYDNIYVEEYLVPSLSYRTRYWWKVYALDTKGAMTGSTQIANFMTWVLGDANRDCETGAADAVFLISYLFRNGSAPVPLKIGDANGDCRADVGDVVFLINYIFRSGQAPKVGCVPPPR